jgi:hypothetical protein
MSQHEIRVQIDAGHEILLWKQQNNQPAHFIVRGLKGLGRLA